MNRRNTCMFYSCEAQLTFTSFFMSYFPVLLVLSLLNPANAFLRNGRLLQHIEDSKMFCSLNSKKFVAEVNQTSSVHDWTNTDDHCSHAHQHVNSMDVAHEHKVDVRTSTSQTDHCPPEVVNFVWGKPRTLSHYSLLVVSLFEWDPS